MILKILGNSPHISCVLPSKSRGGRVGLQPEDSMKRCAVLVLGLTFSATLQVRADEWSKTFKLTGKPELRVETSDANIRVSAWEQDTIEAKVTTSRYKIGENGIRIEDHQDGDRVELEVRFPHHNFNFGSHYRVDIDIHMPREGRNGSAQRRWRAGARWGRR